MNKVRVLQILGSLGIGGNEIFVMNYYRYIDKQKFQVDFLIFDGTRLNFQNEILQLGGKVYICPETANGFARQSMFVYQFLKKHSYDIVHCHNCAFKGLLRGTIPAKLAGKSVVIAHSHNTGMPKHTKTDTFLRGVLKRILCCSIDYGFACSDLAGESKYTRKFMESEHYALIYNAVDVGKFKYNKESRAAIRDRYCIDDDILIGNIGRLSAQKNQKFLLEIFACIHKEYQNIRLIIVGGGELEKELKEFVSEKKLDNYVIFTGSVKEPENYYSAMDVFVMTSLYEGLPFTAVEAQVNGLKCVMADSITSMINISGDVIFLSLNDSKEHWAEQIIKSGECRSEGEKTEKVLQDYDLKNAVVRLENYYKSAVVKRKV